MNCLAAKNYIQRNARPIDLAIYHYFYHQASNLKVLEALSSFQNDDGGFGHGLEPDYWNPKSSPIATNDAIITLFRVNALEKESVMVKGILRYLCSLDSFNKKKKRWLFAIESNKDYPHAIWWEKEGDGIHEFNPSISLAAFYICYGEKTKITEEILQKGLKYLKSEKDISGDEIKCFMLAHELLKRNQIEDIFDLEEFKSLIIEKMSKLICTDLQKYKIEYVTKPSDLFCGMYLDFVTPQIKQWIQAEKEILHQLQLADGGVDITWQWGTDDEEFHVARDWWRPRLTIDKLLFFENN